MSDANLTIKQTASRSCFIYVINRNKLYITGNWILYNTPTATELDLEKYILLLLLLNYTYDKQQQQLEFISMYHFSIHASLYLMSFLVWICHLPNSSTYYKLISCVKICSSGFQKPIKFLKKFLNELMIFKDT